MFCSRPYQVFVVVDRSQQALGLVDQPCWYQHTSCISNQHKKIQFINIYKQNKLKTIKAIDLKQKLKVAHIRIVVSNKFWDLSTTRSECQLISYGRKYRPFLWWKTLNCIWKMLYSLRQTWWDFVAIRLQKWTDAQCSETDFCIHEFFFCAILSFWDIIDFVFNAFRIGGC